MCVVVWYCIFKCIYIIYIIYICSRVGGPGSYIYIDIYIYINIWYHPPKSPPFLGYFSGQGVPYMYIFSITIYIYIYVDIFNVHHFKE